MSRRRGGFRRLSGAGGAALFVRAGERRAGRDRFASAAAEDGLAVSTVWVAPRTTKRDVALRIRSAIGRAAGGGRANRPVVVVAEGAAADAAVLAARSDGRVRAFVLLSGRIGAAAKDALAAWEDAPTLCLVSSEDRRALRDATDVYLSARHHEADIRIHEGLGAGAAMAEAWEERHPDREPLERATARWARRALRPAAAAREVSFRSEDGWRLYATFVPPEAAASPGVVLLHSGRSDRYVLADLESVLAGAGFAVLNVDWRGRGKSTNKGTYFALSAEERARGRLDAAAAVEFIASQAGVDGSRVGIAGVVHGAEHAVRGSVGDARVKALVLLTGYMPAGDAERAHLTSGGVHVLYVSCEAHEPVTAAMREMYERTPDKLTRLLVYEGGAIGYQLFELDPRLGRTIAGWLGEALRA